MNSLLRNLSLMVVAALVVSCCPAKTPDEAQPAPAAKPAEAAKPAPAAEPAPAPKAAEEAAPAAADSKVVTSFKVEGLDDEAKVKKLAEALAGADGVIAAKADKEKGLFNVTYDSNQLCPGRVGGKLRSVDSAISVAGTKSALGGGHGAHGCGGCPKAKAGGGSCGQH